MAKQIPMLSEWCLQKFPGNYFEFFLNSCTFGHLKVTNFKKYYFDRILGESEITKVWVDIQLVEYRSMFEKADRLDISAIPTLMKTSKNFKNVHSTFYACQGKSVCPSQNEASSKNSCHTYEYSNYV